MTAFSKNLVEGMPPRPPLAMPLMKGAVLETVNCCKQTEIPGVLCTVGSLFPVFKLLNPRLKDCVAATCLFTMD